MINQIFYVDAKKADGTLERLGLLETKREQEISETEALDMALDEVKIRENLGIFQWRNHSIKREDWLGLVVTLNASWLE